MKKTIYLLLAGMLLQVLAFAQNSDYNGVQKFITIDKKTGKEIVTNYMCASMHDMVSYDGMDYKTKIKRFGNDREGYVLNVLIIAFNDSVKLMSLTEFCKKNKLNNKLSMVLAGKFYRDTTAANVLFDASRVTSFEQKRDSIFVHMNFDKRK